MISKRTKYALKAILFLTGKYAHKEPVLISEIAQSESIPKKFLEAILLELKKSGILQSRKGKGGGYLLARDPREIGFGEVFGLFENPFALLPCLTQTPRHRCDECRKGDVCGVQIVMQEVYDATNSILGMTTFQDIYDRMRNTQQEVTYSI